MISLSMIVESGSAVTGVPTLWVMQFRLSAGLWKAAGNRGEPSLFSVSWEKPAGVREAGGSQGRELAVPTASCGRRDVWQPREIDAGCTSSAVGADPPRDALSRQRCQH